MSTATIIYKTKRNSKHNRYNSVCFTNKITR